MADRRLGGLLAGVARHRHSRQRRGSSSTIRLPLPYQFHHRSCS